MKGLTLGAIGLLAQATQAQDLLIVDNWWDEYAVALDPYDGHVIDESYIDDLHGNPGEVDDSGRGTLIVSSDYSPDAIYEVGHDGGYLRTIVSGMETYFIDVHGSFVYSRTRDRLLKIHLDTGTTDSLVTGFTGIGDVVSRSEDLLVGATDRILRYDHEGNPLGVFHQAVNTTNYGQINADGPGLIAVGHRGMERTFIETYDATGTLSGRWHNDSVSGAIRLGNGKILVTRLSAIDILDPSTGSFTTVLDGFTFGHVNLVTVPEPSVLILGAGCGLAMMRRRRVQ